MNRKLENFVLAEEYRFVAACERLGINPYKERFWRKEISLLLGVEPETVNRWYSEDRRDRAPIHLFIWNRNGRIFAYRKDLLEAFQDISLVCEDHKYMNL